jgi:hypothetical protein
MRPAGNGRLLSWHAQGPDCSYAQHNWNSDFLQEIVAAGTVAFSRLNSKAARSNSIAGRSLA